VCPIAGCSEPELTTRRGYTTGRGTVVVDGFRHRVAPTPAHAPESISHITAKLLIAGWLRGTGWDVSVERTDVRVLRRPDVHAVKGAAKLAIEVQYSSLPYSQWHQRTTDLESSGYTVIWLWGVLAPLSSVELTAIHQGQLSAGQRLWWIDAAGRRLGVG